jgi:hypothetical protein
MPCVVFQFVGIQCRSEEGRLEEHGSNEPMHYSFHIVYNRDIRDITGQDIRYRKEQYKSRKGRRLAEIRYRGERGKRQEHEK